MCTQYHTLSMRCKVLVFVVLVGIEVLDFISDWLVYVDVSSSEDGLVYGRPGADVIRALLAFSIIGTITFILETTNIWWEIFRDDPWLNNYFLSVVTIWIEDVPQIAINLYIVVCREEAISYFQLVKASLALAELFAKIAYSVHKYCRRGEKCGCSWHEFAIALIMTGLLINAACACAIFVFTQTLRDSEGKIRYLAPTSVFEDQYNDQRYFQNVSIFVHQPEFEQSPQTQQTHWMRLLSISDLKNQPDLDHSYNYVYETQGNRTIMAIYSQDISRKAQWSLDECFSLDKTSRLLTSQNGTVCQAFGSAAVRYYIAFSFKSPSSTFPRRLVFGDVRVNIKKFAAGQCVESGTAGPLLHYFRVGAHLPLSQQNHLLHVQGQPRFYRSDGTDLEDVSKVWKTGWWQCDSSGSMAPHLDRSIPVDCSNPASG